MKRNTTTISSKREALTFVLAVVLWINAEKLQLPLAIKETISLFKFHFHHFIAYQNLFRENESFGELKMLEKMWKWVAGQSVHRVNVENDSDAQTQVKILFTCVVIVENVKVIRPSFYTSWRHIIIETFVTFRTDDNFFHLKVKRHSEENTIKSSDIIV